MPLPGTRTVITPFSPQGCAGNAGSQGTITSLTGWFANVCYFYPFRIMAPLLVQQLFAYNGTGVGGNIDLGIYDAVGTRLVSTGSTAQSGTSVLQVIDVTDTRIGPGLFYLAVVGDNTNCRMMRLNSMVLQELRAMGEVEQATFPLPATATFATSSNLTQILIIC